MKNVIQEKNPVPTEKISERAAGRYRKRVQTVFHGPTKTQQQFADQCDVNKIIERHDRTGELTWVNKNPGVFGDFSEITDYQESLNTVIQAESTFMSLDAKLRARFENDPAQLLDFMHDPRNYDEGVKLGIYKPREQNNTSAPTQVTQTQTERVTEPATIKNTRKNKIPTEETE